MFITVIDPYIFNLQLHNTVPWGIVHTALFNCLQGPQDLIRILF